jgi:hypothetical protein
LVLRDPSLPPFESTACVDACSNWVARTSARSVG